MSRIPDLLHELSFEYNRLQDEVKALYGGRTPPCGCACTCGASGAARFKSVDFQATPTVPLRRRSGRHMTAAARYNTFSEKFGIDKDRLKALEGRSRSKLSSDCRSRSKMTFSEVRVRSKQSTGSTLPPEESDGEALRRAAEDSDVILPPAVVDPLPPAEPASELIGSPMSDHCLLGVPCQEAPALGRTSPDSHLNGVDESDTPSPSTVAGEKWVRIRSLVHEGRLHHSDTSGTSEIEEDLLGVWTQRSKRHNTVQPEEEEEKSTENLMLRKAKATYFPVVEERAVLPCMQRIVLRPESRMRMLWEVFSIMVLSYDVVMTPLSLFDYAKPMWQELVDNICLVFWTVDIIMMFFVGYQGDDEVEMRLKKIAVRYLSRGFALDLGIVVLDWLSIAEAKMLRMSKALRLTRMARLMRIRKVVKMTNVINDLVRSETTLLAVRIVQMIVFILVINHMIACGWWAVSYYTSDGPNRWVQPLLDQNETLYYKYLTSLHWALTQFTPASMEVSPKNTYERTYTVTVMMFGLGMFSSFLSSISSLMTHLRQLNIEQQKEEESVRRYLSEHEISMELGSTISTFLRRSRQFQSRRRLTESDVKSLQILPDSLRLKVHWEIFKSAVIPHPLLHFLHHLNANGFVEVCHRSMTERQLLPGHELFHTDQRAHLMYFVGYGSIEFFSAGSPADMGAEFANSVPVSRMSARTSRWMLKKGSTSESLKSFTNASSTTVKPGRWMAEMVLWMTWIHRGTSIAGRNSCTYFALRCQQFHEDIQSHPRLFEQCCRYAKHYVKRISRLEEEDEEPDDLWGTVDELQEIVHCATEAEVETQKHKSVPKDIWNVVKAALGNATADGERSQAVSTYATPR